MWELLRDPMWDGIGAAIGLVGVVAAIVLGVVLYRLQRRRKELGYRVLSKTRVVSVEAAAKGFCCPHRRTTRLARSGK